jgi:hypothetical protein
MFKSALIAGLVLAVMMLHTQPATADLDQTRALQVASGPLVIVPAMVTCPALARVVNPI